MVIAVLKRVFRHPRYVVWAVVVAFAVFSAGVLLPNWTALQQVLLIDGLSIITKFSFFFSLYGSIFSNFTFFSASYLILIAILFGINIALLTHYIRRRQEKSGHTKVSLASLGGIVSAALGIGCAACGSVVLTAVLGLFGAGWLILLLPFHGAEFGLIGLILLLISIRYLVKRINNPMICPTKYSDPL